MNPTIKTQWSAALRDGSYEQTRARLRRDDGYCCLGVLCDLHRLHAGTGGAWVSSGPEELYRSSPGDLGDGLGLPAEVSAWAGLDDQLSLVGQLSAMNDNSSSFEDIAGVIDEEA